ncbi:dehydrogenase [Aliidongia dinghuensis]|uniref:Dehydrogenase n=1 Tax=Aliidongia dinghuensis TaxID=1867774 RepID=A0A8J2Z1F6_9PROT|nr:SDR family oxidoreductase [Aliidongia dinghuensis]GGF49126.1 dehydrogenase [Aliidongia dinghuensis]
MRHKDKVAVVTGAAQGIGLGCAQRLHDEGARVVLADINGAKVAEAARQLDPDAATAIGVACDVASQAEVKALIAKAVERFGTVDIMVNNAATTVAADPLDLTEEEFDRVMAVNLKGTLFGCQEAGRLMVAKGGGAIVNMSSMQAELAIPTRVPYGVSKAAINQLTKIFALSLATKGVRVNAVAPGTILTDLTRGGVLSNEDSYRMILSRTPMGRCGEVDEIGSVVSFLASSDASYVTGQTLYVDGGRLTLNYVVPVDTLPGR